jgi:hypothetical protein
LEQLFDDVSKVTPKNVSILFLVCNKTEFMNLFRYTISQEADRETGGSERLPGVVSSGFSSIWEVITRPFYSIGMLIKTAWRHPNPSIYE